LLTLLFLSGLIGSGVCHSFKSTAEVLQHLQDVRFRNVPRFDGADKKDTEWQLMIKRCTVHMCDERIALTGYLKRRLAAKDQANDKIVLKVLVHTFKQMVWIAYFRCTSCKGESLLTLGASLVYFPYQGPGCGFQVALYGPLLSMKRFFSFGRQERVSHVDQSNLVHEKLHGKYITHSVNLVALEGTSGTSRGSHHQPSQPSGQQDTTLSKRARKKLTKENKAAQQGGSGTGEPNAKRRRKGKGKGKGEPAPSTASNGESATRIAGLLQPKVGSTNLGECLAVYRGAVKINRQATYDWFNNNSICNN
jgi:hypothetical protein